LRTIIDLRAPTEAEKYGTGPLERAGLDVHRIPFFDERLRPDLPTDGSWTLDDLYLFLVRRAGARIVSAIKVMSEDIAHPLVFHCTAGKDRTGVVAALILGLLGVEDDDIADDYARTATVMPLFTRRARAFLEELGQEAPQFSEHVLTAERTTIIRLLQAVRYDHGSIDGWALFNGMEPETLSMLRATLLEQGSR
jgi:protein-tyrosine phosphatase